MADLQIGDWEDLGDSKLRVVKCYEAMLWDPDMHFDDQIVSGASFNGAIAIARNPSRFVALKSAASNASSTITIYTGSGKLLGQAVCEHDARLHSLHWTARETLLAVYENGAVDCYDVRGNKSDMSFSLFPSFASERVVMVSVSGRGMAAVTLSIDHSYTLYLVNDLHPPASTGGPPVAVTAQETCLAPGVAPKALATIDGAFTASGQMEVLLATADGSIVVVDSDVSAVDQQLQDILPSVVLMISVSSAGKYLSCIGEDGTLTVFDTEFQKKILEFSTHATSQPSQMVWCGEDAVVLAWPENGLMVVGPFGDWKALDYSMGGVHLVQELDCVRIITPVSHELLQAVPPPLLNIKSIGSTAASASLVVAASKFANEDAGCDDLLRSLMEEDSLREAVTECTAAACHAWDTAGQRAMLRAASYGKTFDPENLPASEFVESCKKIRVLNALRAYETGMPLSIGQYDALTADVVVDRLCSRHMHKLALYLCDYLGLNSDRVLVHWACAKVKASAHLSDEAVRNLLRERLAGVSSVSYADIAATADSAGRRRLATMLLDFEPRASDQVPILLRMREVKLALAKALDSGDSDLVFLVLMQLQKSMRLQGGGGGGAAAGGAGSSYGFEESAAAGGAGAGGAGADSFLRLVLSYPMAINLLAAFYRDRARCAPGLAGGDGGDLHPSHHHYHYHHRAQQLEQQEEEEEEEEEQANAGTDGDDGAGGAGSSSSSSGSRRSAQVSLQKSAARKLLLQLYTASGRYCDAGLLLVNQAESLASKAASEGRDEDPSVMLERMQLLQRAAELLKEGEAKSGISIVMSPAAASAVSKHPTAAAERAACASYRLCVEDEMNRLKVRAELAKASAAVAGGAGAAGGSASYSSGCDIDPSSPITEMLYRLILVGDSKRVTVMRDLFKLPDSTFWHVKIAALAHARDWAGLSKFADEKKSPVGYKPFVEACMKQKAAMEAKKYVARLGDYSEKMDCLIALGLITDAAELAAKNKDIDRLNSLGEMAVTPAAIDAVEKALAQLGARGR